MKGKTIAGMVLIVGFASLLLLSFGEQVGGYVSFDEAAEAGTRVHVVGDWVRDRPMAYDRAQNRFTFYMEDERGGIRQVAYANPKPANFEDAEQVVVEGQLVGDTFQADHILVKCPSKYNDAQGIEDATAQPVSTP